MARKIFKAFEVKEIGSKVLITPPHIKLAKEEEAEAVEEVEEVLEPQVGEEIAEVEIPLVEIEKEKLLEEAGKIKEEAEAQAKKIKEEAEEEAFKVLQKKSVEARKMKEDARDEVKKLLEEAEKEAGEKENEVKQQVDSLIQEARTKAFNEGREDGFKTGEEEVKRLIDRLHVIINSAIDKKKRIIENTEEQLIDLILLISRKVIKVISETEKNVVVENVKEALKKLGKETEITIRVNTKDLGLTTKNKREFISLVETLEHVKVEEDDRIGPGGCIIETAFGDVDARIQTQLQVVEEKIRELVPIKG